MLINSCCFYSSSSTVSVFSWLGIEISVYKANDELDELIALVPEVSSLIRGNFIAPRLISVLL
jgi:hypothetical protein